MTAFETIQARAILTALDRLGGGLRADAATAFAEAAAGRRLTTAEKDLALSRLESRRWIASYRNSFTDETLYTLTDEGRVALAGLGHLGD